MITPEEEKDHKPVPTSVVMFPTSQKYKQPGMLDYAWTKFYLNWTTYLKIPMRPDYVNMEVLTQVFQGKRINV